MLLYSVLFDIARIRKGELEPLVCACVGLERGYWSYHRTLSSYANANCALVLVGR